MTGSRRSTILAALVAVGCRPGLPPDPPAEDPANPEAPIGHREPSPDPFERSAFEDEPLDEGEHAHHGKLEQTSHHHHGAKPP